MTATENDPGPGTEVTGPGGPHASGNFDPIELALQEIADGGMVVVVDDEDRENEGDLVMAADAVRTQDVAFIVRHTSGVVCVAITEERADELALPLMVSRGDEAMGTAFTVTVDAHKRFGVTTGVSARDRAKTIEVAIAEDAQPQDLLRPGHINPLRGRDGGVLVRAGHTEGSIDLARLAGSSPSAVICEVMNDDGTMARRPDLEVFAKEHNLHLCTIADLIQYRLQRERIV